MADTPPCKFGLRYPEKASAIVAAGAGSGSTPADREAWSKETPAIARGFRERGMDAMAREMANNPTRIQLKYKDPRAGRSSSIIFASIRNRACRIRWRVTGAAALAARFSGIGSRG